MGNHEQGYRVENYTTSSLLQKNVYRFGMGEEWCCDTNHSPTTSSPVKKKCTGNHYVGNQDIGFRVYRGNIAVNTDSFTT